MTHEWTCAASKQHPENLPRTLLCPPYIPTRQHHSPTDTNTRQHPFISTTFCTLSCPIRTCLAAFCSHRHCQLLQPLQARTKPRRCSRMQKSPSSVRSRTINTRRSLTETTATSPATANRSVTAAEQRRPLYVPNTKNNRNSTRPYLQNQQGSSNHDHETFVDLFVAHHVTAPLRPVM